MLPNLKKSSTAYKKALGWMLFTGTAMLSAFILPIHMWVLAANSHCGPDGCGYVWMNLDPWWAKPYFLVLIFAALYHSFYRIRTIAFDLTWVRLSKILAPLLTILLIVSMMVAGGLLYDIHFS